MVIDEQKEKIYSAQAEKLIQIQTLSQMDLAYKFNSFKWIDRLYFILTQILLALCVQCTY